MYPNNCNVLVSCNSNGERLSDVTVRLFGAMETKEGILRKSHRD